MACWPAVWRWCSAARSATSSIASAWDSSSILFTFTGMERIFLHSTWQIRPLLWALPVFCWMRCSKDGENLMQILLANPRGFCAGVDRAIDIVERAVTLFGAPIYVRHEVVHNKYVVDRL